MRGFLCRKQTCTVTVCDTPLDGPPSVDSTSSSSLHLHLHLFRSKNNNSTIKSSIDSQMSADNRVDSTWWSQRTQREARYWLRIAISEVFFSPNVWRPGSLRPLSWLKGSLLLREGEGEDQVRKRKWSEKG